VLGNRLRLGLQCR